jgi:hypothetical protein
MTARYLLLRPHYLLTGYQPAGVTITEGVDVPVSWVPTLCVDPLNTDAVNAFYSAGPRDRSYEDLNLWAGTATLTIQPVTFWISTGTNYIGSGVFWSLTGLGASKAPIPVPGQRFPHPLPTGGQTPGLPPAGVP